MFKIKINWVVVKCFCKIVFGKFKVGYVNCSYIFMKKLIKWKCNLCQMNYVCVEDVGCLNCMFFYF